MNQTIKGFARTLVYTCGVALAATGSCASSCTTVDCADGQGDCALPACGDTLNDRDNCGACGHACPDGASCSDGVCHCAASLTECGATCADLGADPQHCGACSTACGPVEVCMAGHCATDCGQLATCAGACVDLQTDAKNCGACGASCATGFACAGGACACSDPSTTDCGGACVDLQGDAQHCGACGVECEPGDVCAGGACTCAGAGCGLCGIQALPQIVPQTVNGTTSGAADEFTPSCGDPGSGEKVFSFTAPASGTYAFDTAGSGFDTVLSLVSGASCSQVVCDDDGSYGGASKATLDLVTGETVLVVVDGYGGDVGPFTLHIQEVPPIVCPGGDLGSTVPQTVLGTTDGQPDGLTPSCGAPGSPERTYSFTAPADGAYAFDTSGSSFETVLSLLDGCKGSELACNNWAGGSVDGSRVTVNLAAGQQVIVVVDGYGGAAGPFALHVDQAAPPVCPGGDLGSTVPQTVMGSTAGLGDGLLPSCGAPGSPEMAYTFTAPADGSYMFDTSGSSFDTVVYVLDGCGGVELDCNDDAGSGTSRVVVTLSAGQSVIVVVDGFGGEQGSYTLHVSDASAPGACDNQGFCSDCIDCAVAGVCSDRYTACDQSQDCMDYWSCIQPCSTIGCYAACEASYPAGAALYNDLIACVFCDQCPNDCSPQAGGCP